jgi:hypothetical protein
MKNFENIGVIQEEAGNFMHLSDEVQKNLLVMMCEISALHSDE